VITKLLPAIVLLAALSACGDTKADAGDSAADNRSQAVKFSQCMRDNGVKNFPDPDASGQLTADGVANNSGVDTDSPAWTKAIAACKDLQPAGFTGSKRSAEQQANAIEFAQCIRENGVPDFPDPEPDGPLVNTYRIPSSNTKAGMTALNAAMDTCGDVLSGQPGLKK